jgi:MFS family permease
MRSSAPVSRRKDGGVSAAAPVSSSSPSAPDGGPASRRRVFAAFFLYAFALGGLFPRLPELQRAIGAGEGALGLALTGLSGGTLVSLSLAARWTERAGHRAALLALTPALALGCALAAFATAPWMLFALLLPCGLCIGALEIVVNLEADRVEHHGERRIMSRAHAFWSMGFGAAGLLGAAMPAAGVGLRAHLLLQAALVAVATALLLRRFRAAPQRAGDAAAAQGTPRLARPTRAILALVAVALAATVMEGALADWSAIYMRDVFGAAAGAAGAAVAVGALAQALARFFADGVVERCGPVAMARALLVLLGAGAALVLLAPAPAAAYAGFALMGLGASVIFPLAMSAAARRTDRSAALNVAALAQISFVAFLLGPPLLGWVAQYWGVRWSFGAALPLVALSLAAAPALGRGAASPPSPPAPSLKPERTHPH